MICSRLAPVAASASTGPGSIFSSASAYRRPRMPPKLTPSASAPGNGPRPTAATKNTAQISSEMLRSRLSTAMAALRSIAERTTLRAAHKPSGRPMKSAITLPQSAIYSVSAAGFHSTSENSHFGGHMRAKYSPMTGSAPATSAGRRFTPSAHQRRKATSAAASAICGSRQPGGCAGSTAAIALLHLAQVELQRRGDLADRVVVLVRGRIEARHRAHLAEGEVLHAEERLTDALLHVLGQVLAIKQRVVRDRRRLPDDFQLVAVGEALGAAALVDAVRDRAGVYLARAH